MARPKKVYGPQKLTPEVQEKIVSVIRRGNYIETAAAYAGIAKQTLYNWLRAGERDGEGPCYEFMIEVQKAMAESEIRDLAQVELASRDNWQAAAWRLERRFPKRWGRQDYYDIMMRELKNRGTQKKIVMDFGRASDKMSEDDDDE